MNAAKKGAELNPYSNPCTEPKNIKAHLGEVAKSLRARFKNTHLSVDTVWYNERTRRLWVELTDDDLLRVYPNGGSTKITAWRVIRPSQSMQEHLEMLVDEVKRHQESGVVRG